MEHFDQELSDGLRLVSKLGQGGTCVVYEAWQRDFERAVAVKVLLPHLRSNSKQLQRLRRECRILSQLHHPGIASVYSVGLAPTGDIYLCMELIRGETLTSWFKWSSLQPEQVCAQNLGHILLQLAEAVSYAHGQGIIHRDLKPQNVLLAPHQQSGAGMWRVKVLDFGLAKLVEDEDEQIITATGVVAGSPLYMSPEACRGGPIDERSDIYSFGCIVYEALSGVPPFVRDTPFALASAHINEEPPPIRLSGQRTATTQWLELVNIAQRCLQKAPQDRYQKMSEVVLDLQWVVSNNAPFKNTQPTTGLGVAPSAAAAPKATTVASDRRMYVAVLSRRLPLVLSLLGIAILLAVAFTMIASRQPSPSLDRDLPSPQEVADRGHRRYHEGNDMDLGAERIRLLREAIADYRLSMSSGILQESHHKRERLKVESRLARALREVGETDAELSEARRLFEGVTAYYKERLDSIRSRDQQSSMARLLSESYVNLGLLCLRADKDLPHAERSFRMAMEVEEKFEFLPGFGPLWGMELTCRYLKRPRQAADYARRSIETAVASNLDPRGFAALLVDATIDIRQIRIRGSDKYSQKATLEAQQQVFSWIRESPWVAEKADIARKLAAGRIRSNDFGKPAWMIESEGPFNKLFNEEFSCE